MFDIPSLIPLILLILVNLAVIFRRVGPLNIPAWTAFLGAAVVLIIIRQANYDRAIVVLADQSEVFIFLFGMFILATSLEMSGLLEDISKFMLSKTSNGKNLLLIIHVGFGLAAAILINDTVAIIGPIILITFANQIHKDAKPYVFAIAFAITFGSGLLITGNPQNYILANKGNITFLQFFLFASLPTILSLYLSYLILSQYFKNDFNNDQIPEYEIKFKTHEYHHLRTPTLVALISLFLGLIFSSLLHISTAIPILIVSSVFLFLTNEREVILARVDWGILVLFGGMFVVLDHVTRSTWLNEVQTDLIEDANPNYETYFWFVIIVFIASQVISNVPVAIILSNILPNSPLDQPIFWITGALASTYAGSTTVLGAASNIIVLESASKRGIIITWIEFAKIGIILALAMIVMLLTLGKLYFTFA